MHYYVLFLTYAKNKEGAKKKGLQVLERVINERYFDYGIPCDEPSARWYDKNCIKRANTIEGAKEIRERWDMTRNEIIGKINEVRKLINNKTNEEIMENSMSLYYFNSVGRYGGPGYYIYDSDGEAIRDEKHLENVLKKWNNKDLDDKDIWIVPMDVHS
jgi:hypothetical protein